MANSIALAINYLKDQVALNEVAKQVLLTTDLEAPKVRWIAADTVKLPKVAFGGALGTYSRATGLTANDITLTWETYQLTQDKGNKLILDRMDDEEGLGEGIATFVNQYIRTLVVPAIDTYRFGKLKSGAGTRALSQTVAAADIVDKFLAGLEVLATNEFATEGNIIYITPALDTLLQTSTDLSKYIQVGAFGQNAELRVRMFNGNKIVVVPASRLGSGINFMIVNPTSVMGVVKHNPAEFWERVPGFDGYQVDYRLYHDFFVIENRKMGVYVSDTAAS